MRFLLELSYNGTNYQGWQVQPNGQTVQGVLNNALSVLMRQGIETLGCGRTDAGVHARQYFAQFDTDYDLPETFLRSLNGILPYDIAVHAVRLVAPDFNVRFSAIARTYEYCITFEKNPFYQNFATRWYVPLDIGAMNEACAVMLGDRDFSCFSKVSAEVAHFRCNLMSARWYYRNDLLIFEVTANRFLRSMVRAMVGTLSLVGEGKIDVAKFTEILESNDRKLAGTSVPAAGLYLVGIEY
jgi:tRNA pseudouridine38-40 synthase